ncbi:MurR/RpiR family transcriptional regulator [Spiroplasma poulsonii]|uniref:MurR/RpiR family transcriptional regulator n=1 Tax=Spiroplasma poulsonii TaxID=2138 RepID=A0A3S0SFQ6_9MOLU|nr:MurR/RpiR family transcriptional regulator [Spiroplasma poulsonii]MBW3058170.1 MurR/RpiR family transcriptional regulator [Spiroplasma poulsonii]RUP78280.1 MurR/RpiR family transcriptional regulator [Spiroplasma poulsonii]
MENISILSKLSMIQGSCTKKEVKIANYIRDNVRNIRNIKIEELSKATGIGYSPIYSLIDKLGFKGYRDFIIAIVAEQERLETNNLNLDATENIFLYYQDILQRNNQIFYSDKLLETVTLLKKAKAIYLVGVGNTGLAVKELANRLFSFGFACSNLVEDENNTIMRASLMQPDDLLICMSLEGKTQAVVAAAKEAKNNGANVVAVTSKYNSDLSKYADVNHIVVSSSLYEKSEIFISVLLPLIYWNDNLIQVLLSMDKDRQYLENKVKSNKILKKYR